MKKFAMIFLSTSIVLLGGVLEAAATDVNLPGTEVPIEDPAPVDANRGCFVDSLHDGTGRCRAHCGNANWSADCIGTYCTARAGKVFCLDSPVNSQ